MGLDCRFSARSDSLLLTSSRHRTNSQKPVTMVEYTGTYDRTEVEGYDEFLTGLGVNFLMRKAATASTPVLTVSKEGDVYTFKTSTLIKSMELKFEVGKEFDETTPDGRDVTAIVTQEGDKFISVRTAKKEGQKSTKVTREFFDDRVEQVMEITGTDIVCKQVFTRKTS